MNLPKVKEWVDLVLKSMSIVAIIVAGIWAYYQFNVTDTTESNLELTITTEALRYKGSNRLLLIHVHPRNIGKVPVEPDHLNVIVKVLPTDRQAGEIDLDKLDTKYSTDMLTKYDDGYVLEPGVAYDEVWALILPAGQMYVVRGEIDFDKNESEVDQTVVVSVERDDGINGVASQSFSRDGDVNRRLKRNGNAAIQR